jgi:hypothetical protein
MTVMTMVAQDQVHSLFIATKTCGSKLVPPQRKQIGSVEENRRLQTAAFNCRTPTRADSLLSAVRLPLKVQKVGHDDYVNNTDFGGIHARSPMEP